jgi:aminodeoxyfutalosine synthase
LAELSTSQFLMNQSLIPEQLRPIAEKIEARQRISDEDALVLYRSTDLNALGVMASALRERKNGNYATYIHNRYVNYSNICVLSCQFCAFAAKKRDAHAFEYASDEIIRAVAEALPLGITEVHMVGGLHPTLKKNWYLNLLRGLRALDPALHIKAFTAIEVRHLAQRIFRMSIRDTLELLRDTGLDSITGGGAEIFDARVRDELCRGKETAAEWLDVHRTWHQMGGRSTCTMLYGHIETLAQRADQVAPDPPVLRPSVLENDRLASGAARRDLTPGIRRPRASALPNWLVTTHRRRSPPC